MSQYRLAARRPQGTAAVQVTTPTVDEHGWSAAGHTVVEVVTDDMPFLVDSVTMARPPRPRHPPGGPPAAHGASATSPASCRGLASARPERRRRPTAPRASRGCTSRSTASTDSERLDASSTDLRRVLRDVRDAVEDWTKMQEPRARSSPTCDADPPPMPRRGDRRGCELLRWLADDHFTFLGYREYDLGRARASDGTTCCGACPAPGSGILRSDPRELDAGLLARGRAPGAATPELAGHHQGQLPLDRAPAGLPRLHRRQDLRRRRRGGRRAPLPRPVHLGRLHRASPTSRCCAARSTGVLAAPGFPPTSHAARRCSTSSRPTRATSCSRSPSTSSPRSCTRCCTCRSATGCACSCARTTSAATCPAWSTCRATATRRRCARMQEILAEAFGGSSTASASTTPPGSPSRCWPGCTSWCGRRAGAACGEVDVAALGAPAGRGHPVVGRRLRRRPPTSARRGRRRPAVAPLRRRVPGRLPRGLPAAVAVDRPRPARGGRPPTTGSACTSTSRADAPPGERPVQDLPRRRAALADRRSCRCSAPGRRGGRRAAVRASTAPAGAPAVDLRLRAALRRRARRARARTLFQDAFAAPAGAARPRPTASTGWCSPPGSRGGRSACCGPTPSTCGRPARTFSQAYIEAPCCGTARRPDAGGAVRARGSTRGAATSPADSEPRTAKVRDADRARSPRPSTRWPASTRTGSCARYLAAIARHLRTNYFQPDADGADRSYLSFKLDPHAAARPAASPGRCSRSWSTRRASRACTCASARWPAAGCAGRTGGRTSAPRCSAW